jgi:hypothetical protein
MPYQKDGNPLAAAEPTCKAVWILHKFSEMSDGSLSSKIHDVLKMLGSSVDMRCKFVHGPSVGTEPLPQHKWSEVPTQKVQQLLYAIEAMRAAHARLHIQNC